MGGSVKWLKILSQKGESLRSRKTNPYEEKNKTWDTAKTLKSKSYEYGFVWVRLFGGVGPFFQQSARDRPHPVHSTNNTQASL